MSTEPIDGLGFSKTVAELHRSAEAQADSLERAATNGGGLDEPFFFDSRRASVSTYVEALELVRSRFWATTFLSSGFWTAGELSIIEANQAMMARLRRDGGDVRRLFLLDQPVERVIDAYREQRLLLEHVGRKAELERLDAGFARVRESIELLAESGCSTRFAFDGPEAFRELPDEMSWSPTDSELAIYDDFRVDVFRGGHDGRISSVTGFSRALVGFEELRRSAERFFERLWDDAAPHREIVERLDRAVESSKKRIRYRSNWLARYEYALDPDDENIKSAEAELTKELIRRRSRWGEIASYLDIGTCTGRYLSELNDAVCESGTILGIDDNLESVLFARSNLRKKHPDDERMSVALQEFGTERPPHGGPFDLITCMMSTLSHFGWDRNEGFDDTLQRNLRSMVELLADGGLMVLSAWSPSALEEANLLSIYDQRDITRLAAWTPDPDELERRLGQVGLSSFVRERPDPRLDLWICER